MSRDNPVAGDLVGICRDGDGRNGTTWAWGWANLKASVGIHLVGAVEGVSRLIAKERIADVAHFNHSAGGVGGALLNAAAIGRAAECAVNTERDIGLRASRYACRSGEEDRLDVGEPVAFAVLALAEETAFAVGSQCPIFGLISSVWQLVALPESEEGSEQIVSRVFRNFAWIKKSFKRKGSN